MRGPPRASRGLPGETVGIDEGPACGADDDPVRSAAVGGGLRRPRPGPGARWCAGVTWPGALSNRTVFGFTVRAGRVTGIELLADPETLAVLDLTPVPR